MSVECVGAFFMVGTMQHLVEFFATHAGQLLMGGSIPLVVAAVLWWFAPRRQRR